MTDTPYTYSPAALDNLVNGRLINPAPDAGRNPTSNLYRQPKAPRFTCRRCGEHRDGNLRGHCDDCE